MFDFTRCKGKEFTTIYDRTNHYYYTMYREAGTNQEWLHWLDEGGRPIAWVSQQSAWEYEALCNRAARKGD